MTKEDVMQKIIGDKEYSPIGREKRLAGVDVKEE